MQLIHVRHTARLRQLDFHDTNATVSDENLDALAAVEQEIAAVTDPSRRRRVTVRVTWSNGIGGILSATEVDRIERIGDGPA